MQNEMKAGALALPLVVVAGLSGGELRAQGYHDTPAHNFGAIPAGGSYDSGGSYGRTVYGYSTQWDGFYAGVTAGVGFSGQDQVGLDPADVVVGTLRNSGTLVGLQAGRNFQSGFFVWGFEGDAQFGGVRSSVADGVYDASMAINWIASARARAGVPWDNNLLFASAGLSLGGIDYAVTGGPGPTDISSSYTGFGYNLGVGFEHGLDSGWSLRTEYVYTNFGSRDLSDGVNRTRATPDFHALRVGVNRRF